MSVIKTILLLCDKCEDNTADYTSSTHFTTVKQVELYMQSKGWSKKGTKHFCFFCSQELKNQKS